MLHSAEDVSSDDIDTKAQDRRHQAGSPPDAFDRQRARGADARGRSRRRDRRRDCRSQTAIRMKLLTASEMAARCGLHVQTLRKKCRVHQSLVPVGYTDGGHARWDPAQADRYLRDNAVRSIRDENFHKVLKKVKEKTK